MNTAYKWGQLKELQRLINQHPFASDQEISKTKFEHDFWEAIANLINWGLSVKAIDYAQAARGYENMVWFDVPTVNLWQFYKQICKDLEGLPFAFNNISRKTFTRRLLRNRNYERKKVRYKQKVVVGVGWRVHQIFFDFCHETE
jgi:hypothetical protein